MNKDRKIKFCILSGIPSVIYFFYSHLLKELQSRGWHSFIVSSDDKELSDLQAAVGSEMFSVNITRKITPLRDLIAGLRVFFFFLRKRFDIVHVHSPKGGLIGLTAAFLVRLPVRVYTIHGLPLETASGISRRLLWFSEKLSCTLATHILAVSDSLRKTVINEKLCSPQKIVVLADGTACGIDINRFNPRTEALEMRSRIRQRFSIPENGIVIGFVGRLTPEKGINTLVHSFQALRSSQRGIYLLLVGNIDAVREKLDAEVLNLVKSDSHIFHVGFQDDPVPFYAAMDIFSMPTRREGFGMTFLEANAMNLPVIGSRVTGCIDAVVDGETGLLVDLDNENELAEAILKLVADKQMRFKLGKNGRERVEKYFCSKRLVEAHLYFYNELLA